MEDLIIGKRALSPDAISLTVIPDRILRVRFVNGELRDFDMKPLLDRKCYYSLKNEVLFQTADVAFGTVCWANGLDLDPEWLYEDSVPARVNESHYEKC